MRRRMSKKSIAIFTYKQRLLSIDMKTKLVQHVPRINISIRSILDRKIQIGLKTQLGAWISWIRKQLRCQEDNSEEAAHREFLASNLSREPVQVSVAPVR